MIEFEKFTLDNGLTVIVHKDHSTPMVAMNLLYKVGARNESPSRTGFAHLFEHLMFGGSVNIPEFDTPLQLAGGESNAFTSNDITNFYQIVPAENMETMFWLESDRMLSLAFSEQSLETQRKVVVEEFKENYLNQPYGDAWHQLCDLSYQVHPYKWPTIGLEVKHIEEVTMAEVKDFFYSHYRPDNAIMVLAGNTSTEEVRALAEKWFGEIPAGGCVQPNIPQEPLQTALRHREVRADVPMNAIYMSFHIADRQSADYYVFDLITDVLSNGASSRLYHRLVKEKRLFSELDCYITATHDPGLIVIEGKLTKATSFEEGKAAIWHELNAMKNDLVPAMELQKLKNKLESSVVFGEIGILSRAINLAYFEMLGNADDINNEAAQYAAVTAEDLRRCAKEVFTLDNCSEVWYFANSSSSKDTDEGDDEDDDDEVEE